MSIQCEICPDMISDKEKGTYFDQNRVLTSPSYWLYLFTTKSTYFEESMLNSYLEMLCKDTSGFTVCDKCKSMLGGDNILAESINISNFVKSLPDCVVDKNSVAVVLGSVWKKIHGSWPKTIKVVGFDPEAKIIVNNKNKIESLKEESNGQSLPNKKEENTNKTTKNSKKEESTKPTPLILDSVIKKAEESGWANVLQKQIKEFEKKNNEQEKILEKIKKDFEKFETIEKKNNEQEKILEKIKKDFEKFETKLSLVKNPSQSKLVKFTPVLSLLSLIMLVISIFLTVSNNESGYSQKDNSNQVALHNLEDSIKIQKNEINQNLNYKDVPKTNEIKRTEPKQNESVESNLVSVPNLKDLASSSAEVKLSVLNLNSTIIKVSFGEESIGKVVKQNPAAGKRVKPGTTVILQVGE